MVSYGTLAWECNTWVIDAAPHVTMKVKRIFPRCDQQHRGEIWLRDTAEVARDLEWMLERYPLDMEYSTREHLYARSHQHRETERMRVEIVAGDLTLDLKEPARTPRTYQLQAADLTLTTGRLLLADDLGLGKSFSALLVLRDPNTLPALIVTPTHLPTQWAGELMASLPWLSWHIATTTTPHDVEADVLIMSYSKLAGWGDHLAGQIRTVIFDEVQELRHADTLKYVAAAQVAGAADWRLGLSATPVYNYGGEIHTIFQVLAPGELGSRTEFTREWGGAEMSNGRLSVGNPRGLGSHLRDQSLMLRRTRVDVHRELPDPLRIVHTVDTDPTVLEEAAGDLRALATLIRNTDNNRERFTASGEIDMRMRLATGVAKAAYVAEFVKLLLESEDKVVLFGWHHDVYDIWTTALAGYKPVRYTGTESPKQKEASKAAFVDGDARILMMSLRSGAGLDGLQTAASALVFGELDWSPGMHDQCVGRLARDGQDATVVAYYLVADEGSDPAIAEVLQLKRAQAEPIRNPDVALTAPVDPDTDRIGLLVDAVLSKET